MQVILREKIRKLGNLGESVNVKPGFARNFLVPQGKAMIANKDNLAKFEAERAELEKKALAVLKAAQTRAEKLQGLSVTMQASAGAGGKLFGSIGTRDIADAITAKGVAVEKHEVRLPLGMIRQVGEFDVVVHLHGDLDVNIKVTVLPEGGPVPAVMLEAFGETPVEAEAEIAAEIQKEQGHINE
jgi:large subunit ribosomal protein L9